MLNRTAETMGMVRGTITCRVFQVIKSSASCCTKAVFVRSFRTSSDPCNIGKVDNRLQFLPFGIKNEIRKFFRKSHAGLTKNSLFTSQTTMLDKSIDFRLFDIADKLHLIFRTKSCVNLEMSSSCLNSRKKKRCNRKRVVCADNNSILHSNKFDSNGRILDSRRSLREIKKLCAWRTRGNRRVRLIHLGHLADGEMAFRVKACSESGRIERPSSLRRQSEHNVHVL